MIDTKLKKLLFSIYWDGGWRDKSVLPNSEDYQLLVANKLAFPNEIIGHDDVVGRLNMALKKVDPKVVGRAFLASLSSRRPELRSALYCYGMLKPIDPHEYKGWSEGYRVCEVCRIPEKDEYDFTELTFMRYKFGMGDPLQTMPNVFVLERFEEEDVPDPSLDDLAKMKSLIQAALDLPDRDGANALKKSMKSILKSSDQEKYALIEALGYAGILKPADESEEAYAKVPLRTNWQSPVCLWRGQDGINIQAIEKFFPDYVEDLL